VPPLDTPSRKTMAEQYSRIFLLSHMRAFTSLAGHILGSNPAINGYFEMHLSYEDPSALDDQVAELTEHEALKRDSRYIFDKLLHNKYQLRPDRLGLERIKILVALREPEPTIRSIVALFGRRDRNHVYASPEGATRYYLERLKWLTDFCRSRVHDYYYFDAELFHVRPQALLSALSRWLELEEPLVERYQVFSQTGKTRKGDSSEFIHGGTIARSRSDYAHVQIPQRLLDEAREAYRESRQRMIELAADSVIL